MLNDVIMAVKDAAGNDLIVGFWLDGNLHILLNFVAKAVAVGSLWSV